MDSKNENKEEWSYPTGLLDWPKIPALSSEGWDMWEKDMRRKYPLRYFFYETVRYFFKYNVYHKLREWKWGILHRIHPKYRYHIVKTRLKPGYYDPDTLILESTFALLCNFVEFNTREKIINWDSDKNHANAWKEMNELHDWFINKRPKRNEIFDTRPNFKLSWKHINDDTPEANEYRQYLDELNKAEEEWKNEDTEMLIRLIKIRDYMWYA